MSPIEEFRKLEKQIAAYKRRTDKAEASRDMLMEELRTKRGALSLKHARHLLKTKRAQLEKQQAALESGLEEFEQLFGERLRGRTEEDE